jgi:hypothetical protein
MVDMQLYAQVLPFLLSVVDKAPEDDDVVAGWGAFALFIGLVAAVVFLGFSLTKQLRKADAAKKAGVYGPVGDDDENGDYPAP